MDTRIIPVTDFLRNARASLDLLSRIDKIILTREGRPFATMEITPEEKNKQLLALRGKWDGRLFDTPAIWKAVMVRRNRKKPIKL